MKISEVIEQLSVLKAEHGDISVVYTRPHGLYVWPKMVIPGVLTEYKQPVRVAVLAEERPQ